MRFITVDVRKSGSSVGCFLTCDTLRYPQIPRSPLGTPRTMTSFWREQRKKETLAFIRVSLLRKLDWKRQFSFKMEGQDVPRTSSLRHCTRFVKTPTGRPWGVLWIWSNGCKNQNLKKSVGLPTKLKKIPGPKLKGLCHDSAHVWAVTVADCLWTNRKRVRCKRGNLHCSRSGSLPNVYVRFYISP